MRSFLYRFAISNRMNICSKIIGSGVLFFSSLSVQCQDIVLKEKEAELEIRETKYPIRYVCEDLDEPRFLGYSSKKIMWAMIGEFDPDIEDVVISSFKQVSKDWPYISRNLELVVSQSDEIKCESGNIIVGIACSNSSITAYELIASKNKNRENVMGDIYKRDRFDDFKSDLFDAYLTRYNPFMNVPKPTLSSLDIIFLAKLYRVQYGYRILSKPGKKSYEHTLGHEIGHLIDGEFNSKMVEFRKKFHNLSLDRNNSPTHFFSDYAKTAALVYFGWGSQILEEVKRTGILKISRNDGEIEIPIKDIDEFVGVLHNFVADNAYQEDIAECMAQILVQDPILPHSIDFVSPNVYGVLKAIVNDGREESLLFDENVKGENEKFRENLELIVRLIQKENLLRNELLRIELELSKR